MTPRWRYPHGGAEFSVLGSSDLFLEETQLMDQLLVEHSTENLIRAGMNSEIG